MTDHYINGLVGRQSPEDPSIPVVDFVAEEYKLGGAGNVAANVRSLSRKLKDEVFISTIISDFTAGLLKEKKIFYDCVCLESKDRPHPRELIKTRIMHSETGKQFLRLDNRLKFDEGDLQRYKNKASFANGQDFDAIIVSDYNKGLVDSFVIEKLKKVTCPIFVDTKNPDVSLWKGLAGKKIIFKVNEKEWNQIKSCGLQNTFPVVVTRGENGADYLISDMVTKFNTKSLSQGSAIGCGDVFLAAFAVKYLESNGNVVESISYANKAARKSFEKYAVSEVRRDEL